MPSYPVFLRLEGRRCLVVGGGRVGRSRAAGLREAGASVTVVEPRPGPALRDLDGVEILARGFDDHDCDGMALVFACTDVEDVNAGVLRAAGAAGALACRADSAQSGDFTTPAVLRRGEVCVAVSSGASSPALAARLRDDLAVHVGDEYARAAELLGAARRRLAAAGASRDALASVLEAGFLELLRQGRADEAATMLEEATCTR